MLNWLLRKNLIDAVIVKVPTAQFGAQVAEAGSVKLHQVKQALVLYHNIPLLATAC